MIVYELWQIILMNQKKENVSSTIGWTYKKFRTDVWWLICIWGLTIQYLVSLYD